MLNEEVVREVDALAHRLGTNRSSLINEILAEYVNYTTPEKRVNDILSAVQEMMLPVGDLVPYFVPHSYSLSLKSSLEYKYRPTIKYEVELYKGTGDAIGELSVIFRTQSAGLVNAITDFFRLWKQTEDAFLAPYLSSPPQYSLYDGRLVRTLSAPDANCTADELAEALGEYIRLFDKLLKGYLAENYSPKEVEAACYSFYINSRIHF